MSSVESRIVTMKFDNAQFQKGVASTLSALGKLQAGLSKMGSGAAKGLSSINANASKVNLSGVGTQADNLSQRFSAMGAVALGAFASIGATAAQTGIAFANSFTFGPVMQGFQEYETNMNSIQTILANTQAAGTNLKDVNGALDELNHYADQTIYNFSEMARNIGTFTAAGVDLETATGSIKGIANLAALSGSNSQQASTAMYQLSQAISAGRVSLMDWNSVVNAGMGGTVFQRALANTAVAMGELDSSAVKLTGKMKNVSIAGASFRDSIAAKPGEKPWLTSEVLTATLEQFTGDLNKAELAAMGFKDAQIAAIMEQGKTAKNAATQVKTLSQLIDTTKEGIASGWAMTWRMVFGDFKEARQAFTRASNAIGGLVSESAESRNEMLKTWKQLGGRDDLIESISNAFQALGKVLKPIGQAFRDVFPAMTGERLAELTSSLRSFTEGLMISDETAENLRRTFRGVFAIVEIGLSILGAVIRSVLDLVRILGMGAGSLTEVTGLLGDLIYGFQQMAFASGAFDRIVDAGIELRAAVLEPIVISIGKMISAFAELAGASLGAIGGALADGFARLAPYLEIAGDRLEEFATRAADAIRLASTYIEPSIDAITEKFNQFVETLRGLASGINIGDILDKIADSLRTVFDTLKGFAGGIDFDLGSLFDFGGDAEKASAGVDLVKDSMEDAKNIVDILGDGLAWIGNLFADIGGAAAGAASPIGDFLGSMFEKLTGFVSGFDFNEILALINTGFFIALYATARKFFGNLGDLVGSMTGVLDQVSSNLKTMQTDVRSNIILKIAGALALLAASLLILSKIDSDDLKKSLAAVSLLLIMLVGAIAALEKAATVTGAAQMAILSVALVGLGVALAAFAGAVALLGNLDTQTLIKGLGSVAAILVVITAVSAVLSKTGGAGQMLIAAGGLLILAAALTALAGVFKLFASMDTKNMAEGAGKVALALLALGAILWAFPPDTLATAAGIFLIAQALIVMAGALKIFGNFSIEEMAKSLIMLGGALGILAVTTKALQGSIRGAAALAIIAASLNLLVPSLLILGSMSLEQIAIALIAMAGAFTVLGLAAKLITPFVPGLLGLAGAILLLGLATLAVGAGLVLFAAGLTALAVSGAAGIAVLVAAVTSIAMLIPLIAQQIGLGLIAIAKVIAESGPIIVRALTTVLLALIQSVIKVMPALASAFIVIIRNALRVIRALAPDFIKTAFFLLDRLMNGFLSNIGRIADTGAAVIVAFLKGLARNLGRIIEQGIKTVISFVNGVADGIRRNRDQLADAAGNLGDAIIDGVIAGIGRGIGAVIDAAQDMGRRALRAAMDVLGVNSPSKEFRDKVGKSIPEGMALGMRQLTPLVERTAEDIGGSALSTMQTTMSGISDALTGSVDMNPVISPVLDLTAMTKEANRMSGILGSSPITAGVSYGNATDISLATQAAREAAAEASSQQATEVNYVQNIHSPKAVGAVEVYRGTKSLIALKKEEL